MVVWSEQDYEIVGEQVGFEIVPILSIQGAALDTDAERRWEQARAQNARLFDGAMLDVAEVSGNRLSVRVISYRSFLADRLRGGTSIKPLAVTGYIARGDQILVGKRPSDVTQYPGCYEAVPSGSVNWIEGQTKVDPKGSLLQELEEELGVRREETELGRPLLVYDKKVATFDICYPIRLTAQATGGDPLALAWDRHTAVDWISWRSVLQDLSPVVPTARAICRHLMNRAARGDEGEGS